MTIYRSAPSNSSLIRDVLARAKDGLSIDEIAAQLTDQLTRKQVKAAAFQMCKDSAYATGAPLIKCGTSGRQRFKLAKPKAKAVRFNVAILPSESVITIKPVARVETIEEWERRGGMVERLPVGASAYPLRRIRG